MLDPNCAGFNVLMCRHYWATVDVKISFQAQTTGADLTLIHSSQEICSETSVGTNAQAKFSITVKHLHIQS